MSVSIQHYDQVTVLTVKGDLTGEMVDVLNMRASECIEKSRSNLIVDCSSVGGFDSSALEALVDLQERCDEHLGLLKMCGLDESCAKVLEITRLARRFECLPDVDSAVRSFS